MAESPGFTELGAPSFPSFPVSPLPGLCINSQPWLRALTHCFAPLRRGRPGRRRRWARATGLSPVGPPWAGAEAAQPRGWGVALCATTALAGAVPRLCVRGARGRFGGFGPVPGVVSLSFPPPRPACSALRWRAVPSGCPLPSLAGTPFRTVCAFRALGPVALLVVPACPFRVCALALSRCPLPPPLGGVACAPRVVPALGAGRAVPRGPCPSACPAPVPCSVWRAWGGGRSGPGSPLLGLGLWGWRQGVPGGGALYRCEGRLVSCAPPPPTARPLGGLSGSVVHVSWARACGCGGPALSPRPARLVGAARRGAGL